MKPMESQYILEQDIPARYLADKLSAEEEIQFEEYLMENPEMVDRLELDRVFTQHLPKATEKKTETRSNWMQWFQTPLRLATFAAAVFFLGITVSPHFLAPSSVPDANGIGGNLDIVYLSPLRGNLDTPSAVASLSGNVDTMLLVLQPGETSSLNYTVNIVGKDGQGPQLNIADVAANSVGDVIVPLDVSELQPGMFEVQLKGKADGAKTETLLLQLIP